VAYKEALASALERCGVHEADKDLRAATEAKESRLARSLTRSLTPETPGDGL
jgi:hypothetical protein